MDYGVNLEEGHDFPDEVDYAVTTKKIPKLADMLIAHSSPPGIRIINKLLLMTIFNSNLNLYSRVFKLAKLVSAYFL